MANLEIAGEGNALSHRDKTEGLEDHDGDRAVRKEVPSEELGEYVDCNELVGHSSNNTNGDDEDQCDGDGKDECPDREFGIKDFDGGDSESERNQAQNQVPPMRHFGIHSHETRVNIPFIANGAAELANDIVTVPDYRIGK